MDHSRELIFESSDRFRMKFKIFRLFVNPSRMSFVFMPSKLVEGLFMRHDQSLRTCMTQQ